MSHFRCPNSTLMSAAGYYAYHQPHSTLADSTTSESRPRAASTSSAAGRRVVILDEDKDSTVSSNSTSSSSSSTILAPRTQPRQQPTNDSAQWNAHDSTALTEQQQRQPILSGDQAVAAAVAAEEEEDSKRCWICFGEDEDTEGKWVKPCKCSLVSHEKCLLTWIEENQRGAPMKKVYCPQCATPYVLSERRSVSLSLLSLIDTLAHTAAPYLAFLGLGCSMLITSTTYGAYTVMTILGARESERLIGAPVTWTWRTWFGLPSIPVALIMSRHRWADGILPFAAVLLIRASKTGWAGGRGQPMQMTWPPSPAVTLSILPWIRLLYNNLYLLTQHHLTRKLVRYQRPEQRQPRVEGRPQPRHRTTEERLRADILGEDDGQNEDQRVEREVGGLMGGSRGRQDLGVTIMGALLWPTVSSMVGSCLNHFKIVRQYFPEPFHRNVLGGCLFIVVKDIANLFYRYERIRQRQSRRVRNFDEIRRR
ncbi:hypothetical protein BCR43DRAFT_486429 [Syncephalastrum racemosum]|uniref:RING-CH-type domain-containing protein n=1 Tax=Syncephalastrum racemosum TaxID=13706 RepID=A0A1X2HPA3_SYNRA|nr:hypothetical protein BCR43DRAFT_486429 [Syncephalastrum racemosum]